MRIATDRVTVKVPATIGGLGSGGPTTALAIGLSDTFEVRAATMSAVSRDPFTKALFAGLEAFGAPLFRPEITRTNRILRSRGLGDWAAHTVAGLRAAKAMLGDPEDFDVLDIAIKLGANPTRAKASFVGGCLLGTVRVEPPAFVAPTLFIPDFEVPADATAALPSSVRFERAAQAAESAAILGALMAGAGTPADLMAATADNVRLMHLASVAPASAALVEWLRECDLPAALSGNGSAVVSLSPVSVGVAASAKASGWRVVPTTVDNGGIAVL